MRVRTLISMQLSGLQQQLQKYFSLSTLPVISTDEGAKQYLQTNKNVGYPFGFLGPPTIEVSVEGTRPSALTQGVKVRTDKSVVSSISVIPVKLTLPLQYLTNDIYELINFCSVWMLLARDGKLDFSVEYFNMHLAVKVELDDTFTVPKKDDLYSDKPDVFQYEGNITMSGHVAIDKTPWLVSAPLIVTTQPVGNIQ